MNILIDTNIFLWGTGIDGILTDEAKQIVEDPTNSISFSAASAWEIAIKWSKGRLELPEKPEDFIENVIDVSGLTTLPITFPDAYTVSRLPQVKGHKDPFDRLIVGQAKCRGLSLMTSDVRLKEYDLNVLIYGKK